MEFMLDAAAAALINIGLLGAIMATYIQNMRLIKSYFTSGLVLVASLFIVQNIVIVIFCPICTWDGRRQRAS
jgi:heme A synthase